MQIGEISSVVVDLAIIDRWRKYFNETCIQNQNNNLNLPTIFVAAQYHDWEVINLLLVENRLAMGNLTKTDGYGNTILHKILAQPACPLKFFCEFLERYPLFNLLDENYSKISVMALALKQEDSKIFVCCCYYLLVHQKVKLKDFSVYFWKELFYSNVKYFDALFKVCELNVNKVRINGRPLLDHICAQHKRDPQKIHQWLDHLLQGYACNLTNLLETPTYIRFAQKIFSGLKINDFSILSTIDYTKNVWEKKALFWQDENGCTPIAKVLANNEVDVLTHLLAHEVTITLDEEASLAEKNLLTHGILRVMYAKKQLANSIAKLTPLMLEKLIPYLQAYLQNAQNFQEADEYILTELTKVQNQSANLPLLYAYEVAKGEPNKLLCFEENISRQKNLSASD